MIINKNSIIISQLINKNMPKLGNNCSRPRGFTMIAHYKALGIFQEHVKRIKVNILLVLNINDQLEKV
jgi:hypothetical protein